MRVKATTPDIAVIRQNIDSCLLGTADDWFTNQLSHIIRVGLRNDPTGITEWCNALEARFKDSPGKSLTMLEAIRYTIRDAKNQRDPADYVSSIVLNSKNAGIADTEAAQVLLAYEHLDGELRQNLPRLTPTSTVSDLLDELRHQKDIWFDIYGKHETRSLIPPSNQKQQQKQGQYIPNRQFNSNSFWRNEGFGGYGGPYKPYGVTMNPYGSKPFGYQPYENNNNPQPQQDSQPQQQNVQARLLPGGRQQL